MSEKKKSTKRNVIEWAVLLGFIAILYTTSLGTLLQSRLQQAILCTGLIRPSVELVTEGQPDADYAVRLASLDGETFNLADYQGKTVFINIWATWCPPCLAEMPNIHSLYQNVASDDILFVMINVDDEPEAAVAFMERKDYTFPVYRLTHRLPPIYDSSVLPTTYVIAPNGKLITRHTGMGQYDTAEFKAFLRQLGSTS